MIEIYRRDLHFTIIHNARAVKLDLIQQFESETGIIFQDGVKNALCTQPVPILGRELAVTILKIRGTKKMKLKNLQTLDQNIIKTLAEHKGIDRAIRGEVLAQSLNVDLRTLQSRIEYLQKQECAIGSIDGLGYFVPIDEAERTAGITKKESMSYSIHDAVAGYRRADLEWLDKMID